MRNLIIVLLACLLFTCISIKPELSIQKFDFSTQWDTIRVLKNPYKGWYHHLLDNGISNFPIRNDSLFAIFPGMDHLLLRLAWSYLELEEGIFDWHYIDEVVEKYVSKGYHISFCITSEETGTYPDVVGQQFQNVQYATPYYVVKAGAKGTIVEKGGVKWWAPDWDDPIYLEKLDKFHHAFAARYDGKFWVSYIYIGSIGVCGEGITWNSTDIPPTVEEVKANIDIYLKNYKKSQLVANDDMFYYRKPEADVKTLYEYATSQGITLSDWSILIDHYMEHNLNTWSVSHPKFYNPLYLKRPIVLETGWYKKDSKCIWLGKNGVGKIEKYGYSGAEVMRKAIETMHATYIGYHGYAEEWLADNPDLTKELANLCGYWFFPVSTSFPSIMKRDKNEISIEWLNKGVAPAYTMFGLTLRFESENPVNSFNLLIANSGNKNWLPEISQMENYRFKIPFETKRGKYILKFRLEDQSGETNQTIQIGVNESLIDKNGFIELGKVQVK